MKATAPRIRIGWRSVDITPPQQPVAVCGQFHVRVSEGVLSPLYAAVCAIDCGNDAVIFASCDLVTIPDDIRDAIRAKLEQADPGFDPAKVLFNATHTHTGPEIRKVSPLSGNVSAGGVGVEIDIVETEDYTNWLVGILTEAIIAAWDARDEGGIAYGMDYAVLGRNRRWVNDQGTARMYGLTSDKAPSFSHFEGYEDHSLNLMATYDSGDALTGLIVNIPCPSQEGEHLFQLAADFWHETRALLRQRFGNDIFILPQVSSAGDQTSHLMYDKQGHNRMLQLRGQTANEGIAQHIGDAVERILPFIKSEILYNPALTHHTEVVNLPANALTQDDVDEALAEAEKLRLVYEKEIAKLEANPEMKKSDPRWYVAPTKVFRRMQWYLGVKSRFEHQNADSTLPAELHVLRLGDIAFASNPYELYLDFGVRIKVLSPALQTFIVQLSGPGTYVPSHRSVLGGGYGSMPSSNPVGPAGGDAIVKYTAAQLEMLFPADNESELKGEPRTA